MQIQAVRPFLKPMFQGNTRHIAAPQLAPSGQDTVRFSSTAPAAAVTLNPAYTAAQKAFAFKLLQTVLKQPSEAGKNVLISPASVSMALGMAQNGAVGSTKQAMIDALQSQGLTPDALNAGNKAFIDLLKGADPKVIVKIANSMWADKNYALNPQFVADNKANYGAELTTLDFKDGDVAKNTMNQWVSDNTDKMIPSIIKDVDPSEVLFLINAIFFKGDWAAEFDPKNTNANGQFTNAKGAAVTVPMMTQTSDFNHVKTAEYEAIKMPYGNGKMSMVLMLPQGTNTLEGLQQNLTPTSWDTLQKQLKYRKSEGTISMPKFKSEYGLSLKDTLQDMGMGEAFSDATADFSKIDGKGQKGLYISKVDHKTALEVDEKGSKAAAATSVGFALECAMPMPWQMNVDRPFLVAIQDNESGVPLFIGGINDPTAKN